MGIILGWFVVNFNQLSTLAIKTSGMFEYENEILENQRSKRNDPKLFRYYKMHSKRMEK